MFHSGAHQHTNSPPVDEGHGFRLGLPKPWVAGQSFCGILTNDLMQIPFCVEDV